MRTKCSTLYLSTSHEVLRTVFGPGVYRRVEPGRPCHQALDELHLLRIQRYPGGGVTCGWPAIRCCTVAASPGCEDIRASLCAPLANVRHQLAAETRPGRVGVSCKGSARASIHSRIVGKVRIVGNRMLIRIYGLVLAVGGISWFNECQCHEYVTNDAQ